MTRLRLMGDEVVWCCFTGERLKAAGFGLTLAVPHGRCMGTSHKPLGNCLQCGKIACQLEVGATWLSVVQSSTHISTRSL